MCYYILEESIMGFLDSFNVAPESNSAEGSKYWYEDHTMPGVPYVLFVLENKGRIYHKPTMDYLHRAINNAGIKSYVITSATNKGDSLEEIRKKGVTKYYASIGKEADWLHIVYKGVFKNQQCKCIVPFGTALTQIVSGKDLDMDDFIVPYFRPYFYIGNKAGHAIDDYDNYIFPVFNLRDIIYADDNEYIDRAKLYPDTWVYKHFARVLKFVAKDRSTWWKPDMDPFELHSIENDEQCVEFLNRCMNTEILSFDLETSGFSPWKDKIKCITMAIDKDNGYYIPWTIMQNHVELLSKVMKSAKMLIAVNGKFDLKFLWKNGLDQSIHLTDDLMLMAHCLCSSMHKGLKSLTYKHTYFGGYEEDLVKWKARTGIDDYSKIPDPILQPYASIDVVGPIRIYPELKAEIMAFDQSYPSEKPIQLLGGVQWTVWKWYTEVCMPLENTVSSMEYRGIIISERWRTKHKAILQEELKKTQAKLDQLMGTHINWFSTKELGELLRDRGWPKVAEEDDEDDPFGTDADSMFRWKQMAKAGDPRISLEFCTTLEYLRGVKNCLNSFIGCTEIDYDKKTGRRKTRKTGWEQYLIYHEEDHTWRVHPTYSIMGTETFRMECNAPNFQNIPSHSIGNEYVKRSLGTPTADMYHITANSGKVYHCIELDSIKTVEHGWIMVKQLTEDMTIDESAPDDVVKTYDELHPVPGIHPTTYKQICEEYGYA